jgi:hypothetical protein
VLTGAEALAALGLPLVPLRVDRWLVERGAALELDQPLLEATLLGEGGRLTVLAQHVGAVDRRFPAPSTVVAPDSPLLTLTGVRAFLALPHRLTGTGTGVLLALPPRPAGPATVTVADVSTPVRWGSEVALLLHPGAHRLTVGPTQVEVEVVAGRLTAVRLDPPVKG